MSRLQRREGVLCVIFYSLQMATASVKVCLEINNWVEDWAQWSLYETHGYSLWAGINIHRFGTYQFALCLRSNPFCDVSCCASDQMREIGLIECFEALGTPHKCDAAKDAFFFIKDWGG
jgi:hypothetical protein